jgi:glycosyltransferase involved in cell wall biosynthesis
MRLASEKHPEQLVEAIARLPRQFKLFLVGWGALRQKLLDLANEIAPLRCVIAGAAENLGDYYSAFDAFCLPSESEGFGLATLEAMFCGVPVITTNTGFAPELLVDRVHYLQCTADSTSIAGAINMLAQQPEWAAGLAKSGRQAAEHFGFASRMCQEYEDLLSRLWQQHGSARKKR